MPRTTSFFDHFEEQEKEDELEQSPLFISMKDDYFDDNFVQEEKKE